MMPANLQNRLHIASTITGFAAAADDAKKTDFCHAATENQSAQKAIHLCKKNSAKNASPLLRESKNALHLQRV